MGWVGGIARAERGVPVLRQPRCQSPYPEPSHTSGIGNRSTRRRAKNPVVRVRACLLLSSSGELRVAFFRRCPLLQLRQATPLVHFSSLRAYISLLLALFRNPSRPHSRSQCVRLTPLLTAALFRHTLAAHLSHLCLRWDWISAVSTCVDVHHPASRTPSFQRQANCKASGTSAGPVPSQRARIRRLCNRKLWDSRGQWGNAKRRGTRQQRIIRNHGRRARHKPRLRTGRP